VKRDAARVVGRIGGRSATSDETIIYPARWEGNCRRTFAMNGGGPGIRGARGRDTNHGTHDGKKGVK